MTTRPVPAAAAAAVLALGLAACGGSSSKKTTPAATTAAATLAPSACPKPGPVVKQVPAAGSYRLHDGAVNGAVEATQRLGGNAVVCGWAAGAKDHRAAGTVVILAGGKPVAAVRPTLPRPDVVKALRVKDLDSGFSANFPASALGGATHIKVIGLDGRNASALAAFGCGKNTHQLGDCSGSTTTASACPHAVAVAAGKPSLKGVKIKGKGVIGAVDATQRRGARVAVCGWAAGAKDRRPVSRFVILSGLLPVASVRPNVDRPDLIKGVQLKGRRAGFSVLVPFSLVDRGGRKITVFGIEGKVATQLAPVGCGSGAHDFDC